MAPRKIRIGILTPSSNTALEPLTQAILSSHPLNLASPHNPVITAHFSRFPVTTISLSASGLAQFELAPIIAAAQLLAQAQVDVIGWSGTSAGWLGFEADEQLCRAVEEATSIKATTSVLALNKALESLRVQNLGLVTPYLVDVQEAIVRKYQNMGVRVCTERHLGITRNTDIAELSEEVLDEMVAGVVGSGVQAVTTFCTNLMAAQRVQYWEEKYGVVVLDTVTTVIWDCLAIVHVDVKALRGWGRLFAEA